MTRRNWLLASTIPAAHERSVISPSRHRLTLREWSRQIEIIDSKLSCQAAGPEEDELLRARWSGVVPHVPDDHVGEPVSACPLGTGQRPLHRRSDVYLESLT